MELADGQPGGERHSPAPTRRTVHATETSAILEIIAPPKNGKTGRAYVPTGGADEKRWTNQFVPAVRDHIRAKGYVIVVNCFTAPQDEGKYMSLFDGTTGAIEPSGP